MNPFFFGARDRRLFGIYTPGRDLGAGARGAVLCQPWGQEYLRAHRSMRHLGNLLTRAGVHVLRFDYFGTGDSGGDFADADLPGWEDDIATAVQELVDTTGLEQIGLVGLRLGATLAASVAARRTDVDRLVLWDPVIRGDEYMVELQRAAAGCGRADEKGVREVDGFVVTERMARELAAIDLLATIGSVPARTLVVASERAPSHAALRAALAPPPPRTGAGEAAARFELVEAAPAWVEHRSTGIGAIPVAVLQRVVEWWA